MNLALIGYRGTGKSTVAALLAKELGWSVVSTDALIVERHGPIPEIVAGSGWEHFRDLEERVIAEVCAGDRQIIDCGGGAVLRQPSRSALERRAFVVWLAASVETILERIREDDQRPSLTGEKSFTDEIAEVLATRTPVYREACDLSIDTDRLEPAAVARRIAEALVSLGEKAGGTR